jgi:hypothetical protein
VQFDHQGYSQAFGKYKQVVVIGFIYSFKLVQSQYHQCDKPFPGWSNKSQFQALVNFVFENLTFIVGALSLVYLVWIHFIEPCPVHFLLNKFSLPTLIKANTRLG